MSTFFDELRMSGKVKNLHSEKALRSLEKVPKQLRRQRS